MSSSKNASAGYFNYAKNFTYTAAGALSSMQLGNGKWESTVFNSRLQPTQIALGTVQNGTDKLKLDFEYGTLNTGTGQVINGTNNGNIGKQTITVLTEVRNNVTYNSFSATQYYVYDSLNRIKTANENMTPQGQSAYQSWGQTFNYDRYGNRTFDEAQTTTLPKNCGTSPNWTVCPADKKILNPSISTANNQIVKDQDNDSQNDYDFDSSGNTTKDAQGRTFIYDGENKQIEVKDSQNQTIGQYFYDGDGKRVKKYVPATGETTIFIYDAGGKLVAEYSTVVASQQDAKVSYLTTDHLGSPRINTDQNGLVTARHDYQPFGEEIQRASYGADNVRNRFTSYERDNESDLDFAEARYYNYNHGRFTSVDPLYESAELEMPQSWNRYSYVMNNPLRYTDPSGMIWVDNAGRPEWIANDVWDKMTNQKMYKLWTETEYNSTEGRVRLDPNGPNSDNPAGFTIIGPNIEPPKMSGAAVLGSVAIAGAAQAEPGPGTLLGFAIILGLIGNATTSHEVRQLPLIPVMPTTLMNENKGEGNKSVPPVTPGSSTDDKKADELIGGSGKRSPSYHSELGNKTKAELQKLAKQKGDVAQRAKQMLKLIKDKIRLAQKGNKK